MYIIVTNGINHWILRQPDQVSKTDTMARGHEVLFVATSDGLLVIQHKMEEPQTAVLPFMWAHQCGNHWILCQYA